MKSRTIIKLIKNTNITIEEWNKQKNVYSQKEKIVDLLKLGFATLFLNRTNRSGILKAGVIGGKKQNGKYKLDCRFNKEDICNKIRRISKFKNKIKIYNLENTKTIPMVSLQTTTTTTTTLVC